MKLTACKANQQGGVMKKKSFCWVMVAVQPEAAVICPIVIYASDLKSAKTEEGINEIIKVRTDDCQRSLKIAIDDWRA